MLDFFYACLAVGFAGHMALTLAAAYLFPKKDWELFFKDCENTSDKFWQAVGMYGIGPVLFYLIWTSEDEIS